MNEIWKPIEGYEGKYSVSNLGNVWSNRFKRLLKPQKQNNGYLKLQLGRKNNCTVHRLVATAFVDKPEGCDIVNHINEIKTDNRACNLEWVTSSYNNYYNNAAKKRKANVCRKVGKYKDGELVKVYESVNEAGRQEGTQGHVIGEWISGKTRCTRGFTWKYID